MLGLQGFDGLVKAEPVELELGDLDLGLADLGRVAGRLYLGW